MTTPLDRDLAERLERLAAAVPVRTGQLDPVHTSAVAARHRLRMRWLTPLIVLLLAALTYLLINGVGNGPLRALRLDPQTNDATSPVGTDRDGDFALTLRAGKSNYTPDEPIDVVASLLYDGDREAVEIRTDSSGPIMFGIRESVFGAIDVGTWSLLMCESSVLSADQPLLVPFSKGGGFDGEHPDAAKFREWLTDEELRLPEGTWHLYAVTQAPCLGGDVTFDLRTEIEIVVDDDPDATPGQPVATDWQDKPVYGGDDIGSMMLQVRSAHPTYDVGTPIDLDAWFSFGDGNEASLRPFQQRVEYTITHVDPNAATVDWPREMPLRCGSTMMAWGEERHVPLDPRDVVLIKATSWPDSATEALGRGQLVLPEGRWRITLVVRAEFGPCGSPTETWVTHASVEVDVIP